MTYIHYLANHSNLFDMIKEIISEDAACLWDAMDIVLDPTYNPGGVKVIKSRLHSGSEEFSISDLTTCFSMYHWAKTLAIWIPSEKKWIMRADPYTRDEKADSINYRNMWGEVELALGASATDTAVIKSTGIRHTIK